MIKKLREIATNRCYTMEQRQYFEDIMDNCAEEILDVLGAAENIAGPNNLGKTIDTKIAWTGAISGVMNGNDLNHLVRALEKLRKKVSEL